MLKVKKEFVWWEKGITRREYKPGDQIEEDNECAGYAIGEGLVEDVSRRGSNADNKPPRKSGGSKTASKSDT